jgi:hypothetical protein
VTSCPVTALASLTSHRIVEAMSSGVHKRLSADASSKILRCPAWRPGLAGA